jgi:hypothetical protein
MAGQFKDPINELLLGTIAPIQKLEVKEHSKYCACDGCKAKRATTNEIIININPPKVNFPKGVDGMANTEEEFEAECALAAKEEDQERINKLEGWLRATAITIEDFFATPPEDMQAQRTARRELIRIRDEIRNLEVF